jgi:glutathione S-transferase
MIASIIRLYDFPRSICCQMARLALAEKGVDYARRTIDIGKDANEQFDAWYVELNPKAVVPTLAVGDEIINDTKNIVRRVDEGFDGPPLTPQDPSEREAMTQWMNDIMGLHYGVLLYGSELDDDRVCPTIAARGVMLADLRERQPELKDLLDARIAGNERFQAVLKDPAAVDEHLESTHELVRRLDTQLATSRFVAGDTYSLADTFATAALARFDLHDYDHWWSNGSLGAVAEYYDRVQKRASWATAGVVNSN